MGFESWVWPEDQKKRMSQEAPRLAFVVNAITQKSLAQVIAETGESLTAFLDAYERYLQHQIEDDPLNVLRQALISKVLLACSPNLQNIDREVDKFVQIAIDAKQNQTKEMNE